MNIDLELRKINEAYCIEHLIPIRREFTHAELERPLEQVREAARQLKSLPVLLVEQTLKVPTSAEIDAVMLESLK